MVSLEEAFYSNDSFLGSSHELDDSESGSAGFNYSDDDDGGTVDDDIYYDYYEDPTTKSPKVY